jgi:hypothetical protein
MRTFPISNFINSAALVLAGMVWLLDPSAFPQEPRLAPSRDRSVPTTPVVKEVAPGIIEVGGVRLDKNLRTVTFPAALNMNDGLIEYLIVTTYGKTHESLLRTEIEPYHLQVAMLLLGAKPAPPQHLTAAPPGGPISAEQLAHVEDVKGDPVSIEVSWMQGAVPKRKRIEELVLNLKTKSTMSRGAFTYNGSRLWEGTFIAQREGSIVSTIIDPDAMINNPRPGHEDDEIWQIIPQGLPPLKTPVTVTITLSATKPAQ